MTVVRETPYLVVSCFSDGSFWPFVQVPSSINPESTLRRWACLGIVMSEFSPGAVFALGFMGELLSGVQNECHRERPELTYVGSPVNMIQQLLCEF